MKKESELIRINLHPGGGEIESGVRSYIGAVSGNLEKNLKLLKSASADL